MPSFFYIFNRNIFSRDAKSLPTFANVIPAPLSYSGGKITLRQRIHSLRVWFYMQPSWFRTLFWFFVLVVGVGLSALIRYAYLQNAPNLGVPVDWRADCEGQPSLNESLLAEREPVRIFFGVLTKDDSFTRRELIRSTYLRVKPSSVEFKFVLGRPREKYSELVATEQSVYNDIIVLDIEENMNSGKTYHYFKWVAENYTHHPFDYVVKADDDALVMLDRLENHLRVLPKQLSYWGYLVGNTFMGGECYALSWDLVTWVSQSSITAGRLRGHEDSLVAWWFELGESELVYLPGARDPKSKITFDVSLPSSFHTPPSVINFHPQQCLIFDDPSSETVYSRPYEETDLTKTIVVHQLKTDERFWYASELLLGSETLSSSADD